MLLTILLLLTPQRLDPPKRVVCPGEIVLLRAISRAGAPQAGIAVTAHVPGGRSTAVGVTDASGELRFVPDTAGKFEFHARFPEGPVVIAVYHVVAPPSRWLYALVLTPFGLLLIWRNLRAATSASRPAREPR